MYHFRLGGMDCRCDTADELRAICIEDRLARVAATTSPKETTAIATDQEVPKAKPEVVYERVSTREQMLKNLPFVNGPLVWKVVNRIAKQLGRSDPRQLRSDLKERQAMGE